MQPRITTTEVYDRLRRGEPVQFVDARDPESFARSDQELIHARRILPGQVDGHLRELSRFGRVVVYSDDSGDRAADRVVERLRQLGLRNALVLLGGFDQAVADELPCQPKARPPERFEPVWGHS